MPCPRCGYPCQAGTAYCPSCQLQLVPGAPRRGGTDQMPAWVRDVQAGQGPGGSIPAAEGGAFSARSLMNDDALPQWLREAGASAGGPLPPQPLQPPQPPSGYSPASNAWGQPAGQPGGAPNLYDESNLPSWLFQPGANGSSPQQYDAFPTAHQPSPNGAPWPPYNGSAAAPAPPPAPLPNAFPSLEQAGQYRPAPSGGLSGNSLLDDNALPGWMRGDPSPAQGDPAAAYRDAGGMRGHSLIDDAALPAWLRNQPGPSSAQPYPPGQMAQPAQAAQPQPPTAPSIANWIGGSAANDAMPAWLDQAYNEARIPSLQPPQAQGGGAWPPSGASPIGAPQPGTLNASSLMDESALPEWLRAQGQSQGQGQAPAPPNMARPPMGAPHAGTLADMHTARMPQPGQRQGQGQGQRWQDPRNPSRSAFGNEPEPQRFSASDLIDPDALPGFMQGGNGNPAAAGLPFGAPVGNNGARGRAPAQWPDRDADPRPMRAQPSGRGARGEPIPQDELPPWLAEADPAPPPIQRGAPSQRRGGNTDAYDSRRMPVPRDWDDDQFDASQWVDGSADQDAGFLNEYEDNSRPRGRNNGRRGRPPAREADGDGDGERDWERGGPTGRRRERRGFFGR